MTDTLQNSLTLIWYSACIGFGARFGWEAVDFPAAFMRGYWRVRHA